MLEIANWLGQLGLGRYAQRFAENEIDLSVLPHLTDQDLKEMDIPLGHRRKILAAISKSVATAPQPPKPLAQMRPKISETAERRQVTVLFADLAGSTELSAHMDPEDLREIISNYQKCVAETVRRFDGFVAKYMGDGVLAYFGYPQAHEDDAERAVSAGLDLIERVAALNAPVPLQSRVGIATEVVVVGDMVGSGEAQERGIIGETPKSGGASTVRRGAQYGHHRRGYAEASRKFVRIAGPWSQRDQGHFRRGPRVGGAAAKLGGKPVRGDARGWPDCPRRARRRT